MHHIRFWKTVLRLELHLSTDKLSGEKEAWHSVIEDLITSMGSLQKEPVPSDVACIPFGDAFWPWIQLARKYLTDYLGENPLNFLQADAFFL